MFIGNDDGYSSGVYVSFYQNHGSKNVNSPILMRWLDWLQSSEDYLQSYSGTTFGQIIVTPTEITNAIPDPNDVPYSGFLFAHQVNVQDYGTYADKTSVTIGLIGPGSGAEETQKFIHRLIGSDKPMGWDYQLKDEPVFQISKGRVYRSWISESGQIDFLWGGDIKIGTLESSTSVGAMMRFGNNMAYTYSSVLLNNDRSTNPISLDDGWFFYIGAQYHYIFNLIYLDGNTYKDSPSLDYDNSQLNGAVGFTYAWENFSLSLALNNIELNSSNNSMPNLKEYGSLTFIWRM
jgi:hypothetical protein